MRHSRYLYALLMTLGTLVGCAQDTSIASVEGVVRLDGKPLASGTVRFVPTAGRAATGSIQSDGSYTLGTYSDSDGALVGMHQVAIVAYQGLDDARPAYEIRTPTSKSLVPERYSAVGTSGLTFEVKPGGNRADFDLTTK
jgi:hypothetical protein